MIDITRIYISTKIINNVIIPLFGMCIIMYLVYGMTKSIEDIKINFGELAVVLIKAIAYSVFAYVIYIAYKNKSQIDITTLFTFIFCILESAHNVSIVLESTLVFGIRILFDINKIACIIAVVFILILGKLVTINYYEFERSVEKKLNKAVLIHERNTKYDEADNTITDKNKIDKIAWQYSKRKRELGLSNKEIANRTGIDEETLDKYEHGDFKRIEISDLNILANSLETTPGYLLGWID
ncbi:helix-turn-helix domain-containing protein [Clostridium paraputrificum]|uniref:helix-turn-helix domain-containing protein n=1 Tax=Clostridium paraputrificum TaxID=29363 RepID=UPI00374E697A